MIQVSGHSGTVQSEGDLVRKKTKPEEIRFYQEVGLGPFAPFICKCAKIQPQAIFIENICEGMESPSIIDIKPGFNRVWKFYSAEKNKKMEVKAKLSGSSVNGFKLSGFLLRGQAGEVLGRQVVKGEDLLRKYSSLDSMKEVLRQFYDQGGKVNREWVDQTTQFASKLAAFLTSEACPYIFNGTTLLMAADRKTGKFKVKWIDFSHYDKGEGNEDLASGLLRVAELVASL